MAASADMMHGTCVAIGNRGVLIRGPSGAGKSDLALRLLHLSEMVTADPVRLVSDDQVMVSVSDGRLIAKTAPNLADKLEVRGIGIVPMPTLNEVCVRLVVDAVAADAVSRMPTQDARTVSILSVSVTRLAIVLTEPSATAKVLVALRRIDC